jgi:cell division protein FtsB
MSSVSSQASGNRYRRAFQGSCAGALQHWRVFVVLAVLGITSLSAYEFVAGEAGWIKTQKVQTETRRLLTENTALQSQVKDLKEQERRLSYDDSMVEKLVREQHRLSRPGEILYIFEENPANSASIDGVVVAKRPPKKEEDEEEETRH